MGQTVSKDDVRLAELQSIMRDAQLRLSRLQPLAAAEEAANDPPTPHSSQAAYYAARQRLAVAVDEYRAISRRLAELRCGNPVPPPMPPPTPPFPPEGLTTPAAAAGNCAEPGTPAAVARSRAAGRRPQISSGSGNEQAASCSGVQSGIEHDTVPLLAGLEDAASQGLRWRQRQEGVR
ncbi:hypothetical protein ABPG77_010011 [Micractinium sp. CCAP 211/92]